jgi:hypothetical protein
MSIRRRRWANLRGEVKTAHLVDYRDNACHLLKVEIARG